MVTEPKPYLAVEGASREHNLLTGNVFGEIRAQLRGRTCEAYTSDMRVGIPGTGLYTYPDAVVACGRPQFEDGELDTLLNPTLIVEVLSESTEDYDRGTKFAHYRTLLSLTEYVLVAQDILSRAPRGEGSGGGTSRRRKDCPPCPGPLGR